MFTWACVHRCVCACGGQRATLGVTPHEPVHLVLWERGSYWFGDADWLVSLRGLPFSTSLVLGWRACPAMPGFSMWVLKTQGHHACTARAFLAEPPSWASSSFLHADESAASVIPPSLHQQTPSVHRRRSIRNTIMSNGKRVQTRNVTSKEMMATPWLTEQWKKGGASDWQCQLLHLTKGTHWGSSSWIGSKWVLNGPWLKFLCFCSNAILQTNKRNIIAINSNGP